ncbi:hypothetical protein MKW92_008753, partial [Papaver armeniacum]
MHDSTVVWSLRGGADSLLWRLSNGLSTVIELLHTGSMNNSIHARGQTNITKIVARILR